MGAPISDPPPYAASSWMFPGGRSRRGREPERTPIANADLLALGDGADGRQRHHLLRLVADDLRVGFLRVIAERDHAEDDARPVLPVAEAEVVVPETRLRDAPRILIVVDDHRARHDRRAGGNSLRRHEPTTFALELMDGVHAF